VAKPIYSNPRIICEFLTPQPRVRGGVRWGKKFTTPARIAIYSEVPNNVYLELMDSDSKGSYMRYCVIDCYPYELMKQRRR
jgi:hypothetical protein